MLLPLCLQYRILPSGSRQDRVQVLVCTIVTHPPLHRDWAWAPVCMRPLRRGKARAPAFMLLARPRGRDWALASTPPVFYRGRDWATAYMLPARRQGNPAFLRQLNMNLNCLLSPSPSPWLIWALTAAYDVWSIPGANAMSLCLLAVAPSPPELVF